MPMIARINTPHSPLLIESQAYHADRREWVRAKDATIFDEEWQAVACIQEHGLVDVQIWNDELLEDLYRDE